MMKRYVKMLLVLVCICGCGNLHAQGWARHLIDSLVESVPDTPASNLAMASLYENIGMAYNFHKDYEDATEYFSKAQVIYDDLGDKYGIERMNEMIRQMDMNRREASGNVVEHVVIVVIILILIVVIVFVVREHKKQVKANEQLSVEKKKSEDLILNILPAKIAHELKDKGMSFAEQFDNVTVVITDFVSFTTVAEQFSPQQLVGELHACFKAFDELLDKYNMEKIKTVGDAYLAVSGLPVTNKNHAADAVAFAIQMRHIMQRRKMRLGNATFQMRIGLHSGSVIAGLVGIRKFAYDIWGDTVNTAARMEQNSLPGKINISQTTYDLVKDSFECEYRGEIEAKKKGKLNMYYVLDKRPGA